MHIFIFSMKNASFYPSYMVKNLGNNKKELEKYMENHYVFKFSSYNIILLVYIYIYIYIPGYIKC